jgi:hypothetical protein
MWLFGGFFYLGAAVTLAWRVLLAPGRDSLPLRA